MVGLLIIIDCSNKTETVLVFSTVLSKFKIGVDFMNDPKRSFVEQIVQLSRLGMIRSE